MFSHHDYLRTHVWCDSQTFERVIIAEKAFSVMLGSINTVLTGSGI